MLNYTWLDTPLGPMIAIADDKALHLLEFQERKQLEKGIQKLKSSLVEDMTDPLVSIKEELKGYFEGKLKDFKTPLYCAGSPFQKRVWEELQKIPAGETRSYAAIARAIGRPTACRAVAQANSANRLALVIPCHRVINTNGLLGGYAAGLTRKQWLLDHEKLAFISLR